VGVAGVAYEWSCGQIHNSARSNECHASYLGAVAGSELLLCSNAVFILTLVALMEMCLYPCLRRLNLTPTPLQRISLGGLITASSFVLAGIVQVCVHERCLCISFQELLRYTLDPIFPCLSILGRLYRNML
jgi:hypothetical protein